MFSLPYLSRNTITLYWAIFISIYVCWLHIYVFSTLGEIQAGFQEAQDHRNTLHAEVMEQFKRLFTYFGI